MSSHHFVRDKQEPALLIADFSGFPEELLGQLLEWNPHVYVLQDQLDKINSLGIKIDFALIDRNFDVSDIQADIKIIKLTTADLPHALQYLSTETYAVNVIGKKAQVDILKPFTENQACLLLTSTQKIFPVRTRFEQWLQKGETLEIISFPDTDFSFTGLQAFADNLFTSLKDGIIRIEVKKGLLFLAGNLK